MVKQRYWVKLTLEVHAYDETTQKVMPEHVLFAPATNLTPEPERFITQTLGKEASKLAKAIKETKVLDVIKDI